MGDRPDALLVRRRQGERRGARRREEVSLAQRSAAVSLPGGCDHLRVLEVAGYLVGPEWVSFGPDHPVTRCSAADCSVIVQSSPVGQRRCSPETAPAIVTSRCLAGRARLVSRGALPYTDAKSPLESHHDRPERPLWQAVRSGNAHHHRRRVVLPRGRHDRAARRLPRRGPGLRSLPYDGLFGDRRVTDW